MSAQTLLGLRYFSLLSMGKSAKNSKFEREYYRQLFLAACKSFRKDHLTLKEMRGANINGIQEG